MTIQEALRDTMIRLSNGSRWLVREMDGTYIVYEREYGRKKSTLVIETKEEEKAVAALLEMAEWER